MHDVAPRAPLPLFGEQPEIARWLAEGERLAKTYRARMPAAVAAATFALVSQNDTVSHAVAELCEVRIDARCWAGELFAAYVAWCGANGLPPLSQTAFGKWLSRAGFSKAKGSHGRTRRMGLALKGEVRASMPLAPIAKFVREKCQVNEAAAAASDARFSEFTRTMFAEFQKWRGAAGKPMTITEFGRGLSALGYQVARIGKTRRKARIGIRLKG